MSGLLLRESNCAENEFLAEDTLVTINPTFSHPVFHFVSVRFDLQLQELCDGNPFNYSCSFLVISGGLWSNWRTCFGKSPTLDGHISETETEMHHTGPRMAHCTIPAREGGRGKEVCWVSGAILSLHRGSPHFIWEVSPSRSHWWCILFPFGTFISYGFGCIVTPPSYHVATAASRMIS